MSRGNDYRVAVAIGNPEHAPQLTRTAVDLARERGGEVLVLSIVVTPRASPFALFTDEVIEREFGGERREILDRTVETAREHLAETAGVGPNGEAAGAGRGADGDEEAAETIEAASSTVPIDGRLLVAYDVSHALVDAVVEFDCDALLVGWHERQRRSDFVFGTNVDRVVRRAPCDVLVERLGPAGSVERVLVPMATGVHAELAAEVARAIALANDATVTLLRVAADDRESRRAAEALLADIADRVAPVRVETSIRTGNVAETVVAAANDHDVTVLGTTRQSFLRRQLVQVVPRTVGERADSTVIVAKRPVGVRPRVTRFVHEVL